VDGLRVNGVYLHPAERVVVAAVDAHPFYGGAKSRIQVHAIDVKPGSPTEGASQYIDVLAYQDGSPDLLGVAATSYRDTAGNIDGVFVFTDVDPPGIFAMDVQGEATTTRPSPLRLIANMSHQRADTDVLPAVEAGRWGNVSKIFFAYAYRELVGSGTTIRAGFLTRVGTQWWFTQTTGVVAASTAPDGRCQGGMVQSLVAAYDSVAHEFTLGWMCGQWSAYLQRFDWNGRPLSATPFVAHVGTSDVAHSGPILSFNKFTRRYLFQFQHNAALVSLSGNSFTCTRQAGGNCISPTMPSLRLEDTNASEVDYFSGVEFRMGSTGSPENGPGVQIGDGVTGELTRGSSGGVCPDGWCMESFLWRARPDGGSSMHRYVRAPQSRKTVALHVWRRPAIEMGELRYTLLDETPTVEFDE
jgi:hypothetical protein